MSNSYLPTKTNLIKLQETLRITKQGHELLERKKLILSREYEKYVQDGKKLRQEVYDLMENGKELIRNANIDIKNFNIIVT